MGLTKRATVYFDPAIHKTLKVKAAENSTSISEIINNLLLRELTEDKEDLDSFRERISEPVISYKRLLDELKADGKI
ncbi:MAG: hypothetical protein K9J12_17565 [Melioribacteraceae bacterium]|nr:hypothetical protein [Melioribacteraceae bacterium]MCF8263010.1 hypothetical protein [Melioribacteraceae bacterium]MCF8430455.1 hypothetical protein [Melioribacteraceae bacterium]